MSVVPKTDAALGDRFGPKFWVALIRGILGAALGGVIGFYIHSWMVGQGFYSVLLPGALLGLGFGLAAQHRSTGFGIFCALLALFLGLFSEWKEFPFIVDNSFSYFLTHVHQLKGLTLIMIGLGSLMAFWFGRGR